MAVGPGGKTTISEHDHDQMTDAIYAGSLRGAVAEKNVAQIQCSGLFSVLCALNDNATTAYEMPPDQAAVAIALLSLIDPSQVNTFRGR